MENMLNYFIPEDGDSPDHLNVLPLPQVDQLRLEHIQESFPLPGEFHFRFKAPFEGTYVWLDVSSKNDEIPKFNGLVICKVARIQEPEIPLAQAEKSGVVKQSSSPERVADLIGHASDTPEQKKVVQLKKTPDALNDDLVDLMSEPRATPPSPVAMNSPSTKPTDPFNFFDQNNPRGPSHPQPMMPSNSPLQQNLKGNMFPRGQMPGQMSQPMGSQMGRPPVMPMGQMNMSGFSQQSSSSGSFQNLQWNQRKQW